MIPKWEGIHKDPCSFNVLFMFFQVHLLLYLCSSSSFIALFMFSKFILLLYALSLFNAFYYCFKYIYRFPQCFKYHLSLYALNLFIAFHYCFKYIYRFPQCFKYIYRFHLHLLHTCEYYIVIISFPLVIWI